MRPIRVKSWPGVKTKRSSPSVPVADADPEVWQDRSLPRVATHQLDRAVECRVCGFYVKDPVGLLCEPICRKYYAEVKV